MILINLYKPPWKQNKLFLFKDQGFFYFFKVIIQQGTSIFLSVTVDFIHKSEWIYK